MSGTADSSRSPGESRFRELLEMLQDNARLRSEAEPLGSRFPGLSDVEVRDLVIDGPHGPIAGRTYHGPGDREVGLVWVHGGAFVAGDLDMYEAHWVSLELAARGIAVLSLDHQKALDGVHHPVLSDEILTGWLAAAEDDVLGVRVENLHLGGASAGANLSAGVALRLRDGGGPRPSSLLLVYPVLHAVLPEAGRDAAEAADALPPELRFHPDFMRAVNVNYVGDPALLDDPVAFPANGDLAGLPPVYILNAEADDLRSSGEAFAEQLERAGVTVRGEFEPGTVHGYLDDPGQPTSIASVDRLADWLNGETT
jgi:acetyl esterase/lipase